MQEFLGNVLIYVLFYEYCVFFCELCDEMRLEVDCAKSHLCVISEGLYQSSRQKKMYQLSDTFSMESIITNTVTLTIDLQLRWQ